MIILRVDCTYPGADLESTSVTLRPIGLGETSQAVHAAFSRLLAEGDYFELEAVDEPWPLPFHSETVALFVVPEC